MFFTFPSCNAFCTIYLSIAPFIRDFTCENISIVKKNKLPEQKLPDYISFRLLKMCKVSLIVFKCVMSLLLLSFRELHLKQASFCEIGLNSFEKLQVYAD